jgi:hypothetical protein
MKGTFFNVPIYTSKNFKKVYISGRPSGQSLSHFSFCYVYLSPDRASFLYLCDRLVSEHIALYICNKQIYDRITMQDRKAI